MFDRLKQNHPGIYKLYEEEIKEAEKNKEKLDRIFNVINENLWEHDSTINSIENILEEK